MHQCVYLGLKGGRTETLPTARINREILVTEKQKPNEKGSKQLSTLCLSVLK